jgi:GNAT superfamily N-acetyltransferase
MARCRGTRGDRTRTDRPFDFDDRVVGFLDPAWAWEGIGRALLSVAAAWQRVVVCSRRRRNALDPDVVGRRVEADGEMRVVAV